MTSRTARSPRRILIRRLVDIPQDMARVEIIEGLAAAGELVALVAGPGEGKSAIAVAMTVAVADGSPFLGKAVRRGAAVYLAAERAPEVVRRLRAIASNDPAIYVSRARPALGSASDVDDFIAAIREIAVDTREVIRLVVIDTAARAFRGLEENSAKDMGVAVESLSRIAAAVPEAMVLLVHHSGKDGTGMRGSTALLAAVDVELTVVRKGAARLLEVTKANAIEEGSRLPFCLSSRPVVGGSVIQMVGREADLATRLADPPDARLPRDAARALQALIEMMSEDQPIMTLENWRARLAELWADRRSGAQRQAFLKARQVLTERRLIAIEGDRVSVSDASAMRQSKGIADGAKASALGVSASPLLEGNADAADSPSLPSGVLGS